MTFPPKSVPETGFTLIEISIVLVIIGLVVGGILTGQDLIKAARVRDQIKQFQQYQIAFNAFRLKYNCIPGDCANATSFFGTTDSYGNAINNGNGNGLIDTNTGTPAFTSGSGATWSNSTEMWGALQQLSVAQMIVNYNPGSNITFPVAGQSVPNANMQPGYAGFVIGASYNFQSTGDYPDIAPYQKGTNIMWLNLCKIDHITTMDQWDNRCAIFSAADLQAIDLKIDDGIPLSGNFLGFGGAGGSSNDCLNVAGINSTYRVPSHYPTQEQCQAAFVIN